MILLAALFSILIAATIVVLLRFFGGGGPFAKQKILSDRISHVSQGKNVSIASLRKRNYISDIQSFDLLLTRFPFVVNLSGMLKMAKINMSVSVFFLMCFCAAGFSYLLLQTRLSVSASAILSLVCAYLPYLYLKIVRARYVKKFEEYFPNALNLISSSLKVGHVMESGINAVATTSPYPIADEFKTVQAEVQLGISLQQALQNLYRRIGGQEVKIFVTGVAINTELGGNLSEILDNIEKTIRERFALRREIDALSAQGKASAAVLFAIPFLLGMYMYSNNPESYNEFISVPEGQMCIWVFFICMLVSFLGIRQAIKLRE